MRRGFFWQMSISVFIASLLSIITIGYYLGLSHFLVWISGLNLFIIIPCGVLAIFVTSEIIVFFSFLLKKYFLSLPYKQWLLFSALFPTGLAAYNTYLLYSTSNPENVKHWVCLVLVLIAGLIFLSGFYIALHFHRRENSADLYLENKIEKVTNNGKYSWSTKKVSPRLLHLFRKLYQNPNMSEEEVIKKLEKVADSQLKQKGNVSK